MKRRAMAHSSGRLMARLHLACMLSSIVLTQTYGGKPRRRLSSTRQAFSNCCSRLVQQREWPLRAANHKDRSRALFLFRISQRAEGANRIQIGSKEAY